MEHTSIVVYSIQHYENTNLYCFPSLLPKKQFPFSLKGKYRRKRNTQIFDEVHKITLTLQTARKYKEKMCGQCRGTTCSK